MESIIPPSPTHEMHDIKGLQTFRGCSVLLCKEDKNLRISFQYTAKKIKESQLGQGGLKSTGINLIREPCWYCCDITIVFVDI